MPCCFSPSSSKRRDTSKSQTAVLAEPTAANPDRELTLKVEEQYRIAPLLAYQTPLTEMFTGQGAPRTFKSQKPLDPKVNKLPYLYLGQVQLAGHPFDQCDLKFHVFAREYLDSESTAESSFAITNAVSDFCGFGNMRSKIDGKTYALTGVMGQVEYFKITRALNHAHLDSMGKSDRNIQAKLDEAEGRLINIVAGTGPPNTEIAADFLHAVKYSDSVAMKKPNKKDLNRPPIPAEVVKEIYAAYERLKETHTQLYTTSNSIKVTEFPRSHLHGRLAVATHPELEGKGMRNWCIEMGFLGDCGLCMWETGEIAT